MFSEGTFGSPPIAFKISDITATASFPLDDMMDSPWHPGNTASFRPIGDTTLLFTASRFSWMISMKPMMSISDPFSLTEPSSDTVHPSHNVMSLPSAWEQMYDDMSNQES